MSHLSINAALSERLRAMGLPTAYENAQFTSPAAQVYVEEYYLPAETSAVGMEASSTDDFRGIYQVSVYAPRDAFKLAGMQAAGAVAAQFARGTQLLKDGIRVLIEQVSQASARTVGDRWMIPVSVRFRSLV